MAQRSRTSMSRRFQLVLVPWAILLGVSTAPPRGVRQESLGVTAYAETTSAPSCAGDCNRDHSVTVDELLTMVNIALGNAAVVACSPGDANTDGQVTIDEILTAVNNALSGCGGYSNASLQGVWFFKPIDPPYYQYILFDGAGGVTDLGAFCFDHGDYAVRPDGGFILAVTFPSDEFCDGEEITVDGYLMSQTQGTLNVPDGAAPMHKVSDVATCEGDWDGSLTENGSLRTYAIAFSVGADGAITSFTGFPMPVTGRMYADSDNIVAGFLRASTVAPYFDVKLLGTLSGNEATGVYIAEVPGHRENAQGEFVLSRQPRRQNAKMPIEILRAVNDGLRAARVGE